MTKQSFKWNKVVMIMVLAGFNILVCIYLIHQVKTEKNAYLSLRSEDGFLLMDSLVHQLALVYEGKGVLQDQFYVLEQLSRYNDLDYIRFESLDAVLFQSENTQDIQLGSIREDNEIMEAVYMNQPFTRIIDIGDYETLECVWPFYNDSRLIGVIRLGLSLEFVNVLNDHYRHSTAIALFFLLLFDGLLLMVWRQNSKLARDGDTFNTVLNGISDGVFISKQDGRIIKNRKWADIAGDAEEHQFLNVDDGYSRIRLKDRTCLVLKSTLLEMIVVILRDITVENIAELNKEREKRLFSMGKLSSAFAHEIRNPLNTISMIIQQIEVSDSLNSSEKQMLSIVQDEMKRLNSHVDEYMNIARKPLVNYESVHLQSELEDLVTFFNAEAESRNVSISCRGGQCNAVVSLDREKFRGILINLIKNSINAESSQVEMNCSSKPPFICVSISDNGKGMDGETLEKAFDLYFTTGDSGSGLGLPYVQRIMTAHDGMVKISSEPGKGTDVVLFFPDKGE